MQKLDERSACPPLARLSEEKLRQVLRGFPEIAISSALALRQNFTPENLEACLSGMFLFYLPGGIEIPDQLPSGATLLQEDLGIDSLSLSEAMFKIEELFDIRVENEELAEVTTLTDASNLLLEKLKVSEVHGH